jgi:type VI secretion system ImpM family protein
MTKRSSAGELPGGTTAWYGKVPARGDFVSAGFTPAQVRAWDAWLQQGLRAASLRWPEAGLDQRLAAFPAWRYLAWPAGAGGTAWAGVLVASHDRVGRAFPLTVVQPLEAPALATLDWLDIEAALARMADAALDATDPHDPHDPCATEDFESVLKGLGQVFAPERVAARVAMRVEAPAAARPQQLPLDLLRNSPGTQSLWWVEPPPGTAPLPLGDTWLPHAELMLDILGQADESGL